MANKMRMIDANALHQGIAFAELDTVQDRLFFAEIIHNAPTVDAVPVVHGRWEDEYDGAYDNPRYRCSICKGKALYRNVQNELGNWQTEQALTDYCPNCGAKMDGGNEDG